MHNKPLLVYDGICNLCIAAVRFVHSLDRHELIRYVPYQLISSDTLNTISPEDQEQMHLILENGNVVSGSVAISEICKLLFPITFLCKILRTPFVQKLYTWTAKRRYRIFGYKHSCFVRDEDSLGAYSASRNIPCD